MWLMEDEEEPQLGSCSQETGSGWHSHCQGNFKKATTAGTKIACSDVALAWKGMQMGEEEMEKGSWLLPQGQSRVHDQDARGDR